MMNKKYTVVKCIPRNSHEGYEGEYFQISEPNCDLIPIKYPNRQIAQKTCDYLNHKLVFDFIDCWDKEDEQRIKQQLKKAGSCILCKCHFDSDLLIITGQDFSEMELCNALEIPYDKSLGGNTFMCDAMILNVSKVKEMLCSHKTK